MSALATSRRTLVALAAAALLPAAPAFAAVSAAASVSLSNFSYRLIDLDPTDGVAASFTYQQLPSDTILGVTDRDANSATPYLSDRATPAWTGSLMPTTTTTVSNGLGTTGSIGPGGFALSSQLDTLNVAPGANYTDTRDSSAGMSFYQSGSYITDPVTGNSLADIHVLGAKSLLVIEGTLTVSMTADGVAAFNAYGQTANQHSTASAEATLSFDALLGGGYYIPDPQYAPGPDPLLLQSDIRFEQQSTLSFQKSLTHLVALGPRGELVQYPFGEPVGKHYDVTIPFTLTLSNAADVPMMAALQFITQVTTRSDVVLQPVPEPGTWALMGLGLAGVALARRRQQA